MKKGIFKKLSIGIISAVTVFSAASCGISRSDVTSDLASALSSLSGVIGSGISSAMSQAGINVNIEEPVPFSVNVKKNHAFMSVYGNNTFDDLLEGTYPSLSPVEFELNEEGASLWKASRAYPALNLALEDRNKTIMNLFNTRLNDLKSTIIQSKMKNQTDAYGNSVPFSIKDNAYILRADSKLFSVCDITSVVADPSAPYFFIDTATYDTETGNELSIADIANDSDDFVSAVMEKLYYFYPEADDHLLLSKEELAKGLSTRVEGTAADALPFTVSNIGVTVYFGYGEISDDYYPTVSVCVPFEEYEGLFKADVVAPASDYFSMAVPGGTFYEEEGKVRMIECNTVEDGSTYKTVTDIYVGDNAGMLKTSPAFSDKEGGSYGADFYLLHMDGNNYLFADHYYDNDYRIAETYTVSGDRVIRAETPDDHHVSTSFQNVFPGRTEDFVMTLHNDIMRTDHVVNSYTIDENGFLTAGHKLYFYDATSCDDVGTDTDPSYVSEYTHSYVTTKVDVPVKKVNSIDDPIEKGIDIIVPAGHKLQLIATDMKTYAACSIMDDNTLVLVPVNPEPGQEGMPMYTGSLLLTDAFEGVFWAG